MLNNQEIISDFTFVASYVNSSRQLGKCLNIIVNYRYPSVNSYIDYIEMREMALWYAAEPTEELPWDSTWERINELFIYNVSNTFNISGISSQIQVMDHTSNPVLVEPGNHGTIMTLGDITPQTEPWVNNFLYDCTLYEDLNDYDQKTFNEISQTAITSNNNNNNDNDNDDTWKVVAISMIVITSFLIAYNIHLYLFIQHNKNTHTDTNLNINQSKEGKSYKKYNGNVDETLVRGFISSETPTHTSVDATISNSYRL